MYQHCIIHVTLDQVHYKISLASSLELFQKTSNSPEDNNKRKHNVEMRKHYKKKKSDEDKRNYNAYMREY
jgi:hypothetical protein